MKTITILTATDFSENASQALERAASIAGKIGNARLELVNVVNVRSLKTLRRLLTAEAGPIETLLIEEATAALQRSVQDLSTRFSIEVGSFAAVGNPSEQIVSRAGELDAALIVVGHRGADAARDLFLGSTARNVIRKAPRHVLVVKQPARGPYRTVLAATDFSACSLVALNTAREIAPDAVFTTLHAFEAPFEGKLQYAGVSQETIARYRYEAQRDAQNAARAFADNANITETCTIIHGSPTRIIREYAQRVRPDLIAVGKYGQSQIEQLLIGSVSEYVLANASCDVLVAAHTGKAGMR